MVIKIGVGTSRSMYPEPMVLRHTDTPKRRIALAAAQVGVILMLLVCMAMDGDAESARFDPTFERADEQRFPVSRRNSSLGLFQIFATSVHR